MHNKFFGTRTLFWIGCVEDRDDSKASDGLKLGRVRVRVLGYHSELLEENEPAGEGIQVNQLHWAYPISPVTSAAVNGIGQSPMGVVPGAWVFGFSMDGRAMQDLYILGSLAGVPGERIKPGIVGFCDPNDVYPKDDFLGESDINRLARNEKINETIVETKKTGRKLGVKTADGSTWDEPAPAYAAKYPFNHVHESESGHITEVDDTPGQERTHSYNKSGTFTEIDKDGAKVTKVIGDDFELVLKNKHLYVKGNLNITVDGNAQIRVEGDCHTKVAKNTIMETGENMLIKAGKNMIFEAGDNITVTAGKGISTTAKENITFQTKWRIALSTTGDPSRSTVSTYGMAGNSMTANIAFGDVKCWGRNSWISAASAAPQIAKGVE